MAPPRKPGSLLNAVERRRAAHGARHGGVSADTRANIAAGSSPAPYAPTIGAERAAMIVSQFPLVLIGQTIAAALWMSIARHDNGTAALIAWCAAWLVVMGLSVICSGWHPDPLRRALRGSALGRVGIVAAARSSVWGFGVALMLPASPELRAAAVGLLCALLTGLLNTLGPYPRALLLAGAALAVPTAASLIADATPFDVGLAGGALVFLAIVLLTARNQERTLREVETARARADQLTAALAIQTSAATEARERAEQALGAAQRAIGDRTRFLAAASHDLRQPAHAIGLFVGALKDEIRDGRARYLLDRLDRSMSGLDELFNRLLDISRLDAGTVEPQISVFAVGPLLQTLETRFAPLAEQRGLDFRVFVPRACNLRCDPALLIEMLMNLLSNAFRYTERGAILLGARRRGGRLAIQVWDTGVGIASDKLQTIFEEFTQLGNTARDRRLGLGLGLSIVKRLGDVLDCPVSVRSRPGRGSVFEISVQLSADPTGATASGRDDADDERLRGMLVLVVDDELDILIGMEALLVSWGCFVIVARSIDEARLHLDQTERFPDLIITDHRLTGGQTSENVAETVRELVPVPVPIVVVSGDAGGALEEVACRHGWTLLSKPVNPERLKTLAVTLMRGG
jgi:signal transduction histidine kinase